MHDSILEITAPGDYVTLFRRVLTLSLELSLRGIPWEVTHCLPLRQIHYKNTIDGVSHG